MTTLRDIFRDFAKEALELCATEGAGTIKFDEGLEDLIDEYIDIICKRLIGQ